VKSAERPDHGEDGRGEVQRAQPRPGDVAELLHGEAPSTLAASYCSRGMASRPAIRIRVQNGSDFQMWVSIARPRPMRGSLSQFGPSCAVSLKITELITPIPD